MLPEIQAERISMSFWSSCSGFSHMQTGEASKRCNISGVSTRIQQLYWGDSSADTVFITRAQGPEFNPRTHVKKPCMVTLGETEISGSLGLTGQLVYPNV